MIRTSVMTSLEGRSIAFVNLFLFTIYFTYIIIGNASFLLGYSERAEVGPLIYDPTEISQKLKA